MQYVPFNDLGFDVSRLGFGTMRLPTMQQEDKTVIDRAEAIRMIRHAIDSGVNYVDTAYMYHNGESEIVTGLALKDGYREKVALTTKMPPWFVNEKGDLDRLLDEQLKKLDVPYLDFYILHAMNSGSFDKMQACDYKEFLSRAKKDGRIRHAGFSFHDNNETFHRILDDWDEWEMAQIQFNYLDADKQATEEGLHYAGKRGVGIVIMEPLRGGSLAKAPGKIGEMMAANERKLSPVEWSFRYIADFPEVKTILSGMSNMAQVEDNLKIFDHLTVGGMTDADKKFIEEVKQAYLARMPIGCTGCRYCMPCPNGVAIPNVFSNYNEGNMLDNVDGMKRRYAEMIKEGTDGSKCLECGACESICPQQLPIIDWLKRVDNELK